MIRQSRNAGKAASKSPARAAPVKTSRVTAPSAPASAPAAANAAPANPAARTPRSTKPASTKAISTKAISTKAASTKPASTEAESTKAAPITAAPIKATSTEPAPPEAALIDASSTKAAPLEAALIEPAPTKPTPTKAALIKTAKAKAVRADAGKAPAKGLGKGVIAVAPPSFRRERALLKRGVWPVAGCDEAGRGPLAGPVVAAAVVLDPKRVPKGLDDSKRLTAERREELFEQICATAQVSVVYASPQRINRDNILRASLWALTRAVHGLPELPRHVFVDGRDRLATRCDCEAVIGGDGLIASIAAASIVAKVSRDRLMCRLAEQCPGYGFESHKGYGVPEHLAALARLGPTIHHRRFFAPVAAAWEKIEGAAAAPIADLFASADSAVQALP